VNAVARGLGELSWRVAAAAAAALMLAGQAAAGCSQPAAVGPGGAGGEGGAGEEAELARPANESGATQLADDADDGAAGVEAVAPGGSEGTGEGDGGGDNVRDGEGETTADDPGGSASAAPSPTPDPTLPRFAHGMIFDPDEPERAFFTFDRALLLSPDAGMTWEPLLESKLESGRVVAVAKQPGGDLWMAGPGVLRRSADGGVTWADAGSSAPEEPRGISVHPASSNTLYVMSAGGILYVSRDGGKGWRRAGGSAPERSYGVWVAGLEPVRLVTSNLETRELWATDDEGQSWRHMPTPGMDGQIQDVELAGDGTLYAATIGGLRASTDGGETWTERGPFGAAVAVAVSPADPNLVLIIAPGGGVFRSFDGGLSWGADEGTGEQDEGTGEQSDAAENDRDESTRVP